MLTWTDYSIREVIAFPFMRPEQKPKTGAKKTVTA
jgi:hypothetical protein